MYGLPSLSEDWVTCTSLVTCTFECSRMDHLIGHAVVVVLGVGLQVFTIVVISEYKILRALGERYCTLYYEVDGVVDKRAEICNVTREQKYIT